MTFRYQLRQIRKAAVAGVGAALFAGAAALGTGFVGDGVLTGPEAGLAAGAALAAFASVGGTTFATKNLPRRTTTGRRAAGRA